MQHTDWTLTPFCAQAAPRRTWVPQRRVLVVVHHLTAGTRLGDVTPLLESDNRLQLAFTVPPGSLFQQSGLDYVRHLGGLVLPWQQATTLDFDLAVAASHGSLDWLRAPVLVVSHGAGPGPVHPRGEGHGPVVDRVVAGVPPSALVSNGRVVPAAIGIPHERHRASFARAVPAAAEVTRVVGDPCHDRMTASLDQREGFRRALGVRADQRLVVCSSTHRSTSLLGRHPDLPTRLATHLPSERYRVVAIPHPGTWSLHGRRQVRAWLEGGPGGAGPDLIPPEEGWRAAVIAADLVVGDHGSVTFYAAALGRPVLLAAFPDGNVDPASHTALLGLTAPRLDPDGPLLRQVEHAVATHAPERATWYAPLLTSAPGASARLLRAAMYELLALPEPDSPARALPVPPPRPLPRPEAGDPDGAVTEPVPITGPAPSLAPRHERPGWAA